METEYDSVNAALYSEHVKYDQACKRVLAEKRFLARILKRCVEEYKDSTFDEIAGYIEGTPEIGETPMRPDNPRITGADTEDGSIFEQTVRYDVKFNAAVPGSDNNIGLIINLEAQKKYDTGYPLVKRGVYYCCRLISSQYGREFTRSHYGKLRKVYSIWLCMDAPKSRQNTITEYGIYEKHVVGNSSERPAHYDMLRIVMVCLGEVLPDGTVPGCDDKMLEFMNVLFTDAIKSPVQKGKILENRFDIVMNKEEKEDILQMCNVSYGIAEKNYNKGVNEGRREGKLEGRREGKLEGRREGMSEGRNKALTESLRAIMSELKVSFDRAADLLHVPDAERDAYRKLLSDEK